MQAKRKTKVAKKEKEVTEDMAVELLLNVRDNFPKQDKKSKKK
jgi:hypothetical protein